MIALQGKGWYETELGIVPQEEQMLGTPEYSGDVKNDLTKWSERWWTESGEGEWWKLQVFGSSSQAYLFPVGTYFLSWEFSLSAGPHADLCEPDFSEPCESSFLMSSDSFQLLSLATELGWGKISKQQPNKTWGHLQHNKETSQLLSQSKGPTFPYMFADL